jgi:hypothetical protein
MPCRTVVIGCHHREHVESHHCSTFIAHINDANTLDIQAHPDRHDVPAAQGKYAVNIARLEKSRHQRAAAARRDLSRRLDGLHK